MDAMDALRTIVDSSKSSHCLVTGFITVKKRSAIAMDAAMRFDNLIACSCSYKGINVFTRNPVWEKRLNDSELFICKNNSFTSTILCYEEFMNFILKYDDDSCNKPPKTICVTGMNMASLNELFTDVFVYVNNHLIQQDYIKN